MAKVLHSGFYWPSLFKDSHIFSKYCTKCQATINIKKKNSMLLQFILEVEIFDVWGIDFYEPLSFIILF
ncbi:unnamed protein product [Spirodela intermedia]|uniref:Uncharacterized protein n=1 Tax=Spirodela intermedia TaxID=51605 RepID=A0A7I8I8J5_SPIIN|nr:unnamed protein product [Spirodela intermedia]CAA6653986.1 unnamed protein product [Spirodela intermedia]